MNDIIIEKDGVQYIKHTALFEKSIFPAVMAPFMGRFEPVIVRHLSQAQIRACGEFSLIETINDVIARKKKPSVAKMIAYSEMQYRLLEKTLVSPTYEEIVNLYTADGEIDKIKQQIIEIREVIETMGHGKKKQKLELSCDTLEMESMFFLPSDFVSVIIAHALKIDETDIKEISEEMLYEAAIKAKNGCDNPADHIHGDFTDFNREDINNRAWIIWYERQKERK